MRILLFFFVSILFAAFNLGGCANIVPPSGGPRDTLPPTMLKMEPPDSSRNFRGDEIRFTFDEYIEVKDPSTNISFSPTFETPPRVNANGRTLTIEFEEPLDSNTTYIIDFGSGIVDVNEGNALRNFVYSFSTGPFLDSLEISGRVVLAETGGIDSTLNVVLYRDLRDSAVTRTAPYLVRLNQRGEFRFRYLPSDTFAVYAIGGQKTYHQETQLFAFADQPVISGQTDSLVLYAFRARAPQGGPNTGIPNLGGNLTGRIAGTDRRLRFNTPTGDHDLEDDYLISFQTPLRELDSTGISLSRDSAFLPVNFTSSLDSSGKLLRLSASWEQNTAYNLVLQQDFATDTAGRQLLKTDTIYFRTKKDADYGSLALRIRNLDLEKNPVLQFIQNNTVVKEVPINGGSYSEARFNPGEYSLRVYFDENNNGKWDTGRFWIEKRQPESVLPITRTITVKPAWDNEFEIVL